MEYLVKIGFFVWLHAICNSFAEIWVVGFEILYSEVFFWDYVGSLFEFLINISTKSSMLTCNNIPRKTRTVRLIWGHFVIALFLTFLTILKYTHPLIRFNSHSKCAPTPNSKETVEMNKLTQRLLDRASITLMDIWAVIQQENLISSVGHHERRTNGLKLNEDYILCVIQSEKC